MHIKITCTPKPNMKCSNKKFSHASIQEKLLPKDNNEIYTKNEILPINTKVTKIFKTSLNETRKITHTNKVDATTLTNDVYL